MTAVIDLALNGYIVVTIFLSIVGTLAGILGFVGSNDAMAKQRKGNWLRACLYWVSMLPSVCWYIFPLLPQPRFPSLWSGVTTGNPTHLTVGVLSGLVTILYGWRALIVVSENGRATGKAMVDFLHPRQLLTKGAYRRVRHPMFLSDFITHVGLAVCTGALMALVLMPLYFLMSAGICYAEERWVLRPVFGPAYEQYMSVVPGYMGVQELIVLIMLYMLSAFCVFT